MKPRTRRRRLFWQIFSSFLAISAGLLVVVTLIVATTLQSYFLKQCHHELETAVALGSVPLLQTFSKGQDHLIDLLCHQLSDGSDLRYTVIAKDGKTLGDSDYIVAAMENHAERPEVKAAFANGLGSSTRVSKTVNKKMLYVARSFKLSSGEPIVLRAARPMAEVEDAIFGLKLKISLAWLLASFVAAGLFLATSQRISRPFEALKNRAMALVHDTDQAEHLPSHDYLDEAGGLSEAIQLMVNGLKDRASTISQQREELEAILSSISEALLAVDSAGCILKINRMMADYFGLDAETCRGKKVQALIRNFEFNTFVDEALHSSTPVNANLVFYGPEQHILRGSGTRIRDAEGRVIGAVVVLNDITRLKRLEDLRKDFVANVSHELRTPITSIKGFVETLESGALEEPESARRFLSIISRQTNRLSNIIEDLLSLSKIEQQQDRLQLELETRPLRKVLQGALRLCEEHAKQKEIQLELQCPEDLVSKVHASLFEQAVVNLVDNAIKYSDTNRKVQVSVIQNQTQCLIHVKDQGVGIPRSHLPRLFERFYRVDKARSRDVGGTGLGLSIVKHIMVAHGGTVEVSSEVGQGSTFTLALPLN